MKSVQNSNPEENLKTSDIKAKIENNHSTHRQSPRQSPKSLYYEKEKSNQSCAVKVSIKEQGSQVQSLKVSQRVMECAMSSPDCHARVFKGPFIEGSSP